MAGSVQIRPVVERPRVARFPATGVYASTMKRGERGLELIVLRVIDEVASLDDRVGLNRIDRPYCAGEDLHRQRLLGAERRGERAPQSIEERPPRRRLLVQNVRVR